MTIIKQGRTSPLAPFALDGIERGDDGVLRYTILPATVVGMLRGSVERDPHGEAIVEVGGERLTYRALWDRAARVAGGLRAVGVGPGDRVAIHLPNGVDWVVAFFGALLAGAVAVPVNTRFSEPEVDYVVADSGARVVIDAGTALPDGAPFAVDGGHIDDLAAIFYTSGTTGFPKGAMLAHSCFLATCENRVRVTGTAGESGLRNLVSVPLFHVTGCCSQLMFTLWCGGTTVIMPSFSVQPFLHALVDERITIATSVPAIWWLAINQPNFAAFDTSSAAPPELRRRADGARARRPSARRVPQRPAGQRLRPHRDDGDRHVPARRVVRHPPGDGRLPGAGHRGRPRPAVDPATGVGELLVRGQNVVHGYWNAPERTAETFVDGWLHTGDLARIDADGFVQIVDRLKDMVNRGGENVYCVEVENALVQHPDVFEVAVLGVPDSMMGEKVGAVIVPRPGVDARRQRRSARGRSEQIADFKVPQFITFRDEPLPRNAGGKVLKPILRDSVVWGDQLR